MQYLRTPREVVNPNFIRDDIQKEHDNNPAYQIKELREEIQKQYGESPTNSILLLCTAINELIKTLKEKF